MFRSKGSNYDGRGRGRSRGGRKGRGLNRGNGRIAANRSNDGRNEDTDTSRGENRFVNNTDRPSRGASRGGRRGRRGGPAYYSQPQYYDDEFQDQVEYDDFDDRRLNNPRNRNRQNRDAHISKARQANLAKKRNFYKNRNEERESSGNRYNNPDGQMLTITIPNPDAIMNTKFRTSGRSSESKSRSRTFPPRFRDKQPIQDSQQVIFVAQDNARSRSRGRSRRKYRGRGRGKPQEEQNFRSEDQSYNATEREVAFIPSGRSVKMY
ncbi:hypothetical protein TrispH2_010113 [Trichoplax sp. H2]|nr:hypothetical protein TrispH2_010113 [Trichoplax sp. H2]|eukprot:RDD39081.1 hypothetical protein TrispH2_010113 [Trichoplax sp. H2]